MARFKMDLDEENFGTARGSYRRSPSLDAARDEEMGLAFLKVSPAEFVFAAREEVEGENLPMVSMAGELDIDTVLDSLIEIERPVDEKNPRKVGRLVLEEFVEGLPVSGTGITPADKGESVADSQNLISQESDAGPLEE